MTRTSFLAASAVLSAFLVLSIVLNARFVSAQGQETNTPSDLQENSPAVRAGATAAEGRAPDGQENAGESGAPGQARPWSLRLTAVDNATGTRIPSPEFDVRLAQNQHLIGRGDEDGEWTVEIPSRTPRYCCIRVKTGGYTPMRAIWSNRDNQPLDHSLMTHSDYSD